MPGPADGARRPARLVFRHPDPARRPGPCILPVFLPFLGCPGRCLYCDQHAQTGQTSGDGAGASLAGRLASLRAVLLAREQAMARAGSGPVELGFFGGTFTGLPGDWPERFLALAAEFRDRGVVGRVRCSTRPDAADPDRLARLAGLGLDMVELGVQSFDDAVLAASGRGYTGADALAACAAVREAGMDLGVQLLPGLPGEQRGVFERDVAVTAGLRPQAVRIYPCLVLDGTPLAGMLRAGTYRPWTLARTVWAVGAALVRLWAAAVPVIRIGLAPEPGMQVLAGPVHPALGQLCRSEALYAFVRGRIGLLGWPPAGLLVPRRWMSEFRGHGSGLVPRYARLGLAPDRVRTWDRELFVLW